MTKRWRKSCWHVSNVPNCMIDLATGQPLDKKPKDDPDQDLHDAFDHMFCTKL